MRSLREAGPVLLAGVLALLGACGDDGGSGTNQNQNVAPDAGPDAAADAGPDAATDAGLPEGVHALATRDPAAPAGDLEPFATLVADAEAVGLGEMAHRTGEILELKHRLIRFLVEHEGFRVIAFETDWTDAEAVEAYLQGDCSASPLQVLADHVYEMWHTPTNAELLGWLCTRNLDHPADRVHFLGFNNFQPWHDLAALRGFADVHLGAGAAAVEMGLESCYCAGQMTLAACPDPETTVTAATRDACLGAVDAVEVFVEAHDATLLVSPGEEAVETLLLHAASLRGFQDYQSIASGTISLTAGLSSRDAAMARLFLARHARRHPGLRSVLSSHAQHLAVAAETVDCVYPALAADFDYQEGVVRMGGHLAAALGDGYVATAIVAGSYYGGLLSFETSLADAPTEPPVAERRLLDLGRPLLLADLVTGGPDSLLPAGERFLFGAPDSVPGQGPVLVLWEVALSDLWSALLYIDETRIMPAL